MLVYRTANPCGTLVVHRSDTIGQREVPSATYASTWCETNIRRRYSTVLIVVVVVVVDSCPWLVRKGLAVD